MKPNYVPGVGQTHAKLMIIGEAPGQEEDEYKKPFVGRAGHYLDGMLEDAGVEREDCYITNVSKYRPPMNDMKRLHEIGVSLEDQVKDLWVEIKSIKPQCILALGNYALEATTGRSGITKWRGSVLESIDGIPKVVPSLHPSALMRSGETGAWPYIYRTICILDIEKAKRHAYQDIRPQSRSLLIARDSLDVSRFLNRNRGRTNLMIDIEAIRCFPVCAAMAFDKYEAMCIPLFKHITLENVKKKSRDISKLHLSKMSSQELAHCWQLFDEALSSHNIMGQNVKYDIDKLVMLGFRYGKIVADTSMMAWIVNPELPAKSLEMLQSIYTDEPYHKDEGKEFNYAKDKIENLYTYNGKDAVVQYEVYEALLGEMQEISDEYHIDMMEYFQMRMESYQHYYEMENIGLAIDEEQRDFLRGQFDGKIKETEMRLFSAVGGVINVKSPQQVSKLLYDVMRVPRRKGVDEDTLVALMTNVVRDTKRKGIISDIIDARRLYTLKSRYLDNSPDYDRRMRTTYRPIGTETHRSSTNILSPPVRPDRLGVSFNTLPKHGEGKQISTQYIADEGFVLVDMDLAQAEARVVAVLMRDWELLDAFDRIDIHRRTAALIWDYTQFLDLSDSCPVADNIAKDDPIRYTGKTLRHAGNYNTSKGTAHKTIMTDSRRFGINIDVSEWKVGQMLGKFHEASPAIKGVFHREIKEVIDRSRVLICPFGSYRMFFERAGDGLYREAFAHIPQRTVSNIIVRGMIECKRRQPDLKIVKESYDSLTFLMPEDEYVHRCKEIKTCFPKADFNQCSLQRACVLEIPREFEVGQNLAEMRGFEV